jgi:hypothetical protein
MKMKLTSLCLLIFLFVQVLKTQTVQVSVDINAERKEISPLIFGINNALSDNQGNPLSAAQWQRLRDAGVRMVREFGGNNGTKYNWRLKLSSHPDWYNNVYAHNWNYAAQSLQTNLPGIQGMWCFQLIGKAASNTSNNFNDWAYNNSNWWSGVAQNLAGGGTVNPAGGGQALVNGNPDLYLMNWNADSTTGILDHWFNSLGLDQQDVTYWSMDNEPEIWNGTHDDVMPVQSGAEEFMQKYFETAKKARALFPGIKLLGPVPCNEWQWYNWNNTTILYNDTSYCWLEFFIKRIAEEQQQSGIRLLDVLDLHFYPESSDFSNILQVHRVFFDENYVYPGANGVKNVNGSWDNNQNKEYIFKRCNDWLTKHLGTNHGVTLSLSEMDVNTSNANIVANWYASMLLSFAKNGVEVFTPWSWKTGMWEVLHLFSNYSRAFSVRAVSGNETYLSAFATANSTNDSITLILVNRSQTQTYQVESQFAGFNLLNGNYKTFTLSNLPVNETFVSKDNNALVSSESIAAEGKLSCPLAPLSIKAILITSNPLGINPKGLENKENLLRINYENNGTVVCEYSSERSKSPQFKLLDITGREILCVKDLNSPHGSYRFTINKSQFRTGIYIISIWEDRKAVISKKIKL